MRIPLVAGILKKLTFLPLKPLLFARIGLNYFKLIILRKNVLRVMDIWATEKCQANCDHCCNFVVMRQVAKKKLSLEDYKRIFTAARKLGVIDVHFIGGEPLLCKNLCELIKLTKPSRVIVSLATNGILLKERAEDLKRAGLDMVNVSLDSPFGDIHDESRKFKGCFEAAINGIKEARRVGLQVFVTMVVTHRNINNGEVEEMISLTRKLNVDLQLLPARQMGSWRDNTDVLLDENDRAKFHALTSQWDVRWDGRSNYMRNGCTAGTERMIIDSFGNVQSCTFIPASFGNIFQDSLENIYRSMSNDDVFKKRSSVCRYAFDPEFMKKLELRMAGNTGGKS